MEYNYDLIIIGSGPGGYVAAIKAGQKGKKTLIVEKDNWGGVCLNIGCIPTKALIKSAKVFDYFKHAVDYGIDVNSSKPNWKKMQERKQGIVKQLTNGVSFLLKKNKVQQIIGTARAIDKNTIEVENKDGKKQYTAKNLIIATGSVSRNLLLSGFEEAKKDGFLITSRQALSLPTIPKELIIIGGGVIGVEFAYLYNSLGTKVTIIQALPTILEMLDEDVRNVMTDSLRKKGIIIETKCTIKEIKNKTLIYEQNGTTMEMKSDYILISVGRVPILSGFENLNLALDDKNHIIVDDKLETSVKGVYAIGDVLGKKMLAHVASMQALVAVENIVGKSKKMSQYIPSCIYTQPEVASVGLTQHEAEQKYGKDNIKVFLFPLIANGKALCEGDTEGFTKLIITKKYGEIIGAHIVGSVATEMISAITGLMESEATIDELSSTIYPHPTLSETIMEAGEGVIDKPIHF